MDMLSFVGPAALAFVICLIVGPFIIPMLQKMKFGQVIRG